MLSNEKVEINVIGAMLNNANLLYECVANVGEDFFSSDETKAIFNKIVEMSEKGKVTERMLVDRLKGTKEKSLVRTANNSYIDAEHFKRDYEELKDIYYKRQLYYITNNVMQQLQSEKKADLISEYIGEQLSGIFSKDNSLNIVDPSIRGVQAYEEYLDRRANPGTGYGLRFKVPMDNGYVGFPSIDNSIMGAQKGDLILIAAKTGVGKTALGINIARLFSLLQNHYGYYANGEMQLGELEARAISPLAGVTVKEILSGELEGSPTDIRTKDNQVSDAMDVYRKSKFFPSRIPNLTVQRIKGSAKQILLKHKKLDYIIVDYIQRMTDTQQERGLGEHDRLRKIAMRLKELAVELEVPIIILGQRNFEGFIEGAKSIANECDAVFYFEPINEDDVEHLKKNIQNEAKRNKINYKIIKFKVRRDDNPFPIYCTFDKKKQFINEVLLD